MARSIRYAICMFALSLVGPELIHAQHHLTASEARAHIGETATVCGEVVSTRYASSTKGRPTFLNLDKPYPGQIFTIVIWGEDRAKFGAPEETYRGKHACVTGKIGEYRGVPEVVATEPGQLMVEGKQLCSRVPAVYLTHATFAILATPAERGMNNFRRVNPRRSSTPTRASNTSSHLSLMRVWSVIQLTSHVLPPSLENDCSK